MQDLTTSESGKLHELPLSSSTTLTVRRLDREVVELGLGLSFDGDAAISVWLSMHDSRMLAGLLIDAADEPARPPVTPSERRHNKRA